jgi:hypothetical protein
MFIGHNAFAFVSKRVAPRGSLGVYTAAVMLPDLIWPIFLLLGIEHVRIQPGATRFTPLDFYDYLGTHSLLMTVAWGLFFSGIYMAITHYFRGAIWVLLGVVSHWVLDFIVHRPDLPLYPNGPKVGLGLWNSPPATIVIESAMFAIAVLLYRSGTQPVDRIGSIGMWSFIIALALIYIANASGNPPPSARAVAYLGLAGWLLPFWAGWFDRHRQPIE